MSDYLDTLNQEELERLNLSQSASGGYEISWPESYNVYSATVGRFLGPENRNRPAMIFEAGDGTVSRMTFADVDAAATGLAGKLRELGYGKGDPVALHTGQHPDTAIGHMAIAKILNGR